MAVVQAANLKHFVQVWGPLAVRYLAGCIGFLLAVSFLLVVLAVLLVVSLKPCGRGCAAAGQAKLRCLPACLPGWLAKHRARCTSPSCATCSCQASSHSTALLAPQPPIHLPNIHTSTTQLIRPPRCWAGHRVPTPLSVWC